MVRTYPEYELQKKVCEYLRTDHPDILFMSDTIASVKLNVRQAVRNKAIQKDGFKTPDLIIFEPRGNLHGLFIELKVTSPYTKAGYLKSDKHLEAQSKTMIDLCKKRYYACFATGYSESVKIIEDYLSL